MSLVDKVRWEDLTTPAGVVPLYELDVSKQFFYLKHDRHVTAAAQFIGSFEPWGHEERMINLPWCGPYPNDKAAKVVRWFINLVEPKVDSGYGVLVAWKLTDRGEICLVSAVTQFTGDEFGTPAPDWFKDVRYSI